MEVDLPGPDVARMSQLCSDPSQEARGTEGAEELQRKSQQHREGPVHLGFAESTGILQMENVGRNSYSRKYSESRDERDGNGRWRQEDYHEFKDSLGYVVSLRPI